MKQLKRLLLSMMLICVGTIVFAQSEIAGTVVDSEGEPIIGATIMEKGTSNGTVTNFDGEFRLKVAAGKTLTVSFVCYQTIEMAAANGMKVTLQEDAQTLNEVVVTGYTTQRKSDLTGAVTVVSVGELAHQGHAGPCAWHEHLGRRCPIGFGNSTYSRYRHPEQQRPSIYYRWCAHQSWYARTERQRY